MQNKEYGENRPRQFHRHNPVWYVNMQNKEDGENRPRQFHRHNPILYVNMQNKEDGEANLENKEPFLCKLVMGDGNVYNGMNGERRIGGDVIG